MHAFAQPRQAARAYARVDLSSNAMSASPHQLVTLLFDGAQAALRKAGQAIAVGDAQARGTALSKAIDIIERGLRAGLDLDQGGELAVQLDLLYDYMTRRLLIANLKADGAAVAEVERLMGGIASSWKEIGSEV